MIVTYLWLIDIVAQQSLIKNIVGMHIFAVYRQGKKELTGLCKKANILQDGLAGNKAKAGQAGRPMTNGTFIFCPKFVSCGVVVA